MSAKEALILIGALAVAALFALFVDAQQPERDEPKELQVIDEEEIE